METLNVQLRDRAYPIYLGQGLLTHTGILQAHIRGGTAIPVSNETIAPLYGQALADSLGSTHRHPITLPDGETHKDLGTLNRIYTELLEHRCGRDTTLLALGGGVIGDITGFAAATYQRGIDFIQVPTTLLAQVDASVGGKTGINHPLGKNMIGAFHQPRCVVIDTDTLNTLPAREFSAGLAEVIKYGLIRDRSFLVWLESNIKRLLARDPDALHYAVRRSCENKAAVVAADEREHTGARALLNFGHTFGHAIEAGLGYGQWLHGEAVSCGMAMAARLSARSGWLPQQAVARIEGLLQAAQLPTNPPAELPSARFLELMAVDKKAQDGRLRLILLRNLGEAVVTADFDPALLEATLAAQPAA